MTWIGHWTGINSFVSWSILNQNFGFESSSCILKAWKESHSQLVVDTLNIWRSVSFSLKICNQVGFVCGVAIKQFDVIIIKVQLKRKMEKYSMLCFKSLVTFWRNTMMPCRNSISWRSCLHFTSKLSFTNNVCTYAKIQKVQHHSLIFFSRYGPNAFFKIVVWVRIFRACD